MLQVSNVLADESLSIHDQGNCIFQIGANCELGPYAHVHPDTELADGVDIGNFVEVKRSRIGAGTKAKHLAYIGDATLGQKVNVGAGSITSWAQALPAELSRLFAMPQSGTAA